MATVTLYRITRTKCFMAREQGECFSLHPWGDDTAYYEGYDDGGAPYILPDGFEVAISKGESAEIYGPNGEHYQLTRLGHTPQIIGSDRDYLLKRADSPHETHYDASAMMLAEFSRSNN